jgi:hypothetical protein
MDVGGFHQEVENLTEQRNWLMRFRNGTNMPIKMSANTPNPTPPTNILNHSLPRQRMNLPLPIRRPRQLGVMKHDEPIIERHVNICLDSVGAVFAGFRERCERVLSCRDSC